MDTLLQDLRYGIRILAKSPGFTAVAVLCLALGIGVNTAIFSLIDALLLRPLPGVEDPARLVNVYTSDFSSGRFGTSSYPDYIDYRDQNQVFSELAAYASNQPVNLSTGSEPERVPAIIATGNYFSVLGVKAALGRTLLPEDDRTPGAHPVAVISYQIWERDFGSARDVIGKTLTLNGHSFTVIGVAPKDFRGTDLRAAPAVWVPMAMYAQINPVFARFGPFNRRGARTFFMVGRLKPEVSLEQAQANIDAIAAQLAQAYPNTNLGTLQQPDKPRPMTLVPISHAMIGPPARESTKRFTQVLMAVVGFVLLIACANVANLLLARARGRQREIAVRLALGARRSRIVRQMLTESMLLSFLGGGLGLLIALWLSDLLLSLQALASFTALDLSLDSRVLGFTLAASLLTGILFGLAPALHASRPSLIPALKDVEIGSGTVSRQFGLRNLLVVFQVALSLVLLIGAGLFLKSLQQAYATDLGFQADNGLLASVDMARQGYSEAQARTFYQQLVERVEGLPGVRSVTLAQYIPINAGGSRTGVFIEGYTPQPGEDLELNFNIVDQNYFQTLGIPLLMGRSFGDQDAQSAPKVVIINETMARRYWSGENPLGKQISLQGPQGPFHEIVGVVKTGKYRNLREEPIPYFYAPFSQQYQSRLTIFVRTAGEPNAVLPALRAEVQRLDKNLPLFDVRTLAEHLGIALAQERTSAMLIGSFALLALILAAVGIYGLMSYAVAQRTHEIGIRLALGAQAGDVLKLVLWQSLKLAGIGVAIGLAGALAITHLVSSMLYVISPTDPSTFAGVALILTAVMLFASFIPARRAAKVDPMIALRYE